MKILEATLKNIIEASRIVKKGGLVVFPTETVYGLGCDPFNVGSVQRLIEIKGNRTKPFPILISSMNDARKIANLSLNGKKLATRFWPGPLTIIFPKKSTLPDIVTFNQKSVGLRIPDNKVAIKLIRLCGGILIGSSANKTGRNPPKNIDEIPEELEEIVDIVLNGGPTSQGVPSTVVDFISEKPKILRDGPINLKQLLNVLALSS
ncbi:MAG: L-threonylcarbamoyladenylate synthase [Candidatus Bathyarchaeota archaeon]